MPNASRGRKRAKRTGVAVARSWTTNRWTTCFDPGSAPGTQGMGRKSSPARKREEAASIAPKYV